MSSNIPRALDDHYDAFLRHGSSSHRAMVAGLGGAASLALGGYVIAIALVTPASAEARAATLGLGLFAIGAGNWVKRMGARLPQWAMDLLVLAGAVYIGFLAVADGPIRGSIVTLLIVFCAPLWVSRTDWALAGFTALMAATYAAVLEFGPPSDDRLARWIALVAALVVLAVFTRWLLSNVENLLVAERRARREAEEAQVRLAEARRARMEFGRRLSHELRTPLNVIVGYSQMLGSDGQLELTPSQRSHAADILASARHLGALIDDVLQLESRPGATALTLEDTDLEDLLASTCRMMSERARRDGLNLSLRVEPDLPRLLVDRRKISQVVLNLLGNALKFTPRGGSVEVSAHQSDAHVEVVVRDTGPGIELHQQPLVFEEFHTTGDPSASTGLGLPLARDFVKRHGGTMWLESEPLQGSQFHFRIPIDPDEYAPDTVISSEQEATSNEMEEATAWDAFTRPGSLASRQLIGRVTARIVLTGCLVSSLVVLATPSPGDRRGFAIAGPAIALLVLALPWRLLGPRALRGLIDAGAVAVTLAVTTWLFIQDHFEDVLPLAYLWVPLTAFVLWPRVRAAGHLALVVLAYGAYLVIHDPPGPDLAALIDLIALLAIPSGIVSWAVEKVRAFAVAENQARVTAELLGARLSETTTDMHALLRGVSHDLRTPLNSVIGFARLLTDDTAIDPVARNYAAEIGMAAAPLLALVNDTLELARLEDESIKANREEIRLADLIERAWNRATPPASSPRSPRLELAVDEDLVVEGDERLIDRLVFELLENALRFGPVAGTVRVEATRFDDRVELCVSDEGQHGGRPDLERAFEAFVHEPSAAGTSSSSGPGLGLALARRIAQLHNGDLSASRGVHGVSFVFSLPDAAPASPVAQELAL